MFMTLNNVTLIFIIIWVRNIICFMYVMWVNAVKYFQRFQFELFPNLQRYYMYIEE